MKITVNNLRNTGITSFFYEISEIQADYFGLIGEKKILDDIITNFEAICCFLVYFNLGGISPELY